MDNDVSFMMLAVDSGIMGTLVLVFNVVCEHRLFFFRSSWVSERGVVIVTGILEFETSYWSVINRFIPLSLPLLLSFHSFVRHYSLHPRPAHSQLLLPSFPHLDLSFLPSSLPHSLPHSLHTKIKLTALNPPPYLDRLHRSHTHTPVDPFSVTWANFAPHISISCLINLNADVVSKEAIHICGFITTRMEDALNRVDSEEGVGVGVAGESRGWITVLWC